ncbi:MAG: bifunctional methylenetetrahydrofolate dehydrogenase/methenyltetrahydrofolate cyclohydrolase, partial [Eubacterium sp.]|nr:bifunctional methylenetetrahydrofolate dehydrogenase/methenyltetrahydrofolate cyclohydrolase [Eubacterium sp.]
MAEIIDGKKISQELKDDVKKEVEALTAKGIEPALSVIIVGQDPSSTVYVNNKKKACEYTGIK